MEAERRAEASVSVQEVKSALEKLKRHGESAGELTFSCPDCLDTAFVYVADPHENNARHEAVRPCWSCAHGIAVQAGLWFRRVYSRGRGGRFVPSERAFGIFRSWLEDLHVVTADRIKTAFDQIVDREKAEELRAKEAKP